METQNTPTKRFSLFQLKSSSKPSKAQNVSPDSNVEKRPVGRPRKTEGYCPATHTSVALEPIQLEKIRYISRIQGLSMREVMHQLLGHSIRYYEKRHGEIVVQLPAQHSDKSIFD